MADQDIIQCCLYFIKKSKLFKAYLCKEYMIGGSAGGLEHVFINIYIWRFPKMGVPLNYPF